MSSENPIPPQPPASAPVQGSSEAAQLWQRVKEVFGAALQLEDGARRLLLEKECQGNPALRAEVQSLLTFAEVSSAQQQPPPPERPTLAIGTRLGNYEVVSLLRSGGFGGAYRAHDLQLCREVAIKILPATLSADAAALRRFEREALATARLNHPHIVTIHSIEHVGDVHLIVMELVEGEPLDRMIPEGGLSVEKFLDLAADLADAVAAAHDKGIIHCDLKPSNIMVTDRGSIKVLDFGIAKMTELVSPGSSDQRLSGYMETEPGIVIGTVPYMSPEQLLGKKLDCRTDIFSLGVVFYQMATGQRPFHGDTPAELMTAILRDQPKPVIELRPDLPRSLQSTLERCLIKEAAERYSTPELRESVRQLRQEFVDRYSAPATSTEGASVAVLPFLNLSADPENEFFADGMTEEIINALAQIKQLHVAARTSSFSFKGKHVDLRIIGERLNVRTVLEGSIRRSGNHLRVTAQLVNVADGYHLWSEKYDREMRDVFEIQDEISRSIAERLKVSLESEQPLVKAGTENLEAYQLYLKGRALFFQRGPRLRRALECFERAAALDSNYAQAWGGVADARNMLTFYGLLPPEVCLEQAKEAALRAVHLDPSLAEAHTALALSHLFAWDPAQAEFEFLRALELNPRYFLARDWYGLFWLHWRAGRVDKAFDHLKQAVDSDPLSGYAQAILAVSCSDAGKGDEALQAAQAAVDLDPDSFLARWFLLIALRSRQRFEESVAAGEASLAISGRHPYCIMSLAQTYAAWGKPDQANALYMELLARARREYVQPTTLAITASAAGEMEAAVQHAQEAWRRRDPALISVRYFSEFALLRQDPRFQEILVAMGFS